MAGIDHADDIGMLELGELWEEFHHAVNMTSDELAAWLRTQSAGEVSEDLPEEAGTEQGRHVLSILRKRQTDLTDADIRTMREVVRIVAEEHPEGPASGSVDNADQAWRHRLMRIGHDPPQALVTFPARTPRGRIAQSGAAQSRLNSAASTGRA